MLLFLGLFSGGFFQREGHLPVAVDARIIGRERAVQGVFAQLRLRKGKDVFAEKRPFWIAPFVREADEII